MENLERIVAKIVEEANEKAKFILDDAENKANEILSKANNKFESRKKELENEYDLIEKSELDRVKSATALKSRNILLEAKQESMSYIFGEIENKIKEISYDDMKNYVLKTLNTRVLAEGENLIIPKAYEGLDLGREYRLSDSINTGFLIEKDGIVENYTLEALINLNRDEIESKILAQLFN